MGVQQFSARKVARLNRRWGWALDMVWNTQGTTTWYEGRLPGDRHVLVNVRTGETAPVADPVHMSSCRIEGLLEGL